MSITAIIVICLVFAMMLGPLMLLQPSSRQKQLANLRQKAFKLGLKVQLQMHQGHMVSVYQKSWPSDSSRKWCSQEWRLVKKGYPHEIHFLGLWDWDSGKVADQACYKALRLALEQLPNGVAQLSGSKLGVSCHWDEAGGESNLDMLSEVLSQLSAELWLLESE